MARTTGNAKDLITFTRASTGTFLGSNGLLQTAAINTPRVEYDANGVAKGLLIEEARTNLIPDSEDLTAASWAGKTQHTGQANAAISPAGTQTATRITSTGTDPYLFHFTPVTAGNDYVLTVWLRGIGNTVGRTPRVWFLNNSGTISSTFDSTPLTDSWQKYTVTGSCTGSGTVLTRIDFDDSGLSAPGEQVDVWGAQVEAGSFPTSYIPTSGATATRSADIASVSVSEFGYNQAQGSVVVEFSSKDDDPSPFSISDGTPTNRMLSYVNSSNIRWYILNGAASQANVASSVSYNTDTNYKAASVYAANDFAISVNGELPQIDSAGSVPTSVSLMNIGTSNSGGGPLNGHIKSINYYPLRLSDAKLQELTS